MSPSEPLVLLLDDDAALLRSLSRALRAAGARVMTFERPEPIAEQLGAEIPHVMVIDYVLGGDWTGGDVAAELRERLRQACPPLILLSGTVGDVKDEHLALFDHAIAKGGDVDTLIHQILARAAHEQSSRSNTAHRGEVLGEIGRRTKEEPGNGTHGAS